MPLGGRRLARLLLAPALLCAQVPEFVHGDECLFCHRNDIGPQWRKNRHGITVRQREDAPELAASAPPEAEYFLGSRRHVRFLKKQGYGKFAIRRTDGTWDNDRFADRCAGCHSTAVDPKTRAFAAFGLDCYTCHGSVNLEHSNDTSLIWLSKTRRTDAKAVTAICAQCHLRGARSRSTGLPYPAAFTAGGDLFGDYEAGFARAGDPGLNPGDRHVWRNAREVMQGGSGVTCLTCHRVHSASGNRHRLPPRGPVCYECHSREGAFQRVARYTVRSELCEY